MQSFGEVRTSKNKPQGGTPQHQLQYVCEKYMQKLWQKVTTENVAVMGKNTTVQEGHKLRSLSQRENDAVVRKNRRNSPTEIQVKSSFTRS